MARSIFEIRADRDALRTKKQTLGDELHKLEEFVRDDGSLAPEHQRRWDDIIRAADKVNLEIEKVRDEEVDAIREAASKPGALEDGSPGRDNSSGGLQVLRRTDVWGDEARGVPMPDRAKKAAEIARVPDSVNGDASRERIFDVLERHQEQPGVNGNPLFEQWLVAGSDPAYRSAFEKALRDPQMGPMLWTDQERAAVAAVKTWQERAAMNEGTTTQGGYMVPSMLDPAIVLTNDGVQNAFRQLCTIKTIATKTYTGVTSAGVTATWRAEAAEASDGSPTVGTISITPTSWDNWIQASFELVQDSDLSNDIAMLIADAKDRLEGTGFTLGTGSTQPTGIITAVSGVTASRVAGSSGAAGAADFVVADIYAVDNALPQRARQRGAAWMANISTINKARQFATGSGPQHAFWADLGAGVPPTLLGHPIYENSDIDSTIVSGSNDDILLLGNFKAFYLVDRVGTQMIYNPLVVGSNRRPTGEVGWYSFGRTGSGVADVNQFRLLRL